MKMNPINDRIYARKNANSFEEIWGRELFFALAERAIRDGWTDSMESKRRLDLLQDLLKKEARERVEVLMPYEQCSEGKKDFCQFDGERILFLVDGLEPDEVMRFIFSVFLAGQMASKMVTLREADPDA